MTDIELQIALVKELKKMELKHLDGSRWEDFHIYKQGKPYKKDSDTDDQENYIIVALSDEDTNKKEEMIVEIQMLISIYLYDDENKTGDLELANLMNYIDRKLREKRIIDGKYEIEPEIHKRFNPDCYPYFYESAYITKWKLPEIDMKGIGELI